MDTSALHQAEQVAARRWQATAPRAEHQAQLLAAAERVAAARWVAIDAGNVAITPQPLLPPAEQLLADAWWATAPAPRPYCLLGADGRPLVCARCGGERRWAPVGDPERRTVHTFVCEHGLPRDPAVQAERIALADVVACTPVNEE